MKLLLINKNPVVSRMMMMSVPKAGFDIETCEDVYQLPSGNYDVVVIDDEMYDENFLQVIKQNLKYYQLGLISASKSAPSEEFDFVLSKPFLPTDLIEILRKIKTDIESQKEQVPLYKEEKKEEPASSPFDMFMEEEKQSEEPIESIVEIQEEPEESPFVTEEMQKSGVLDENEVQEVNELLEEKDIVSPETPESILTEPKEPIEPFVQEKIAKPFKEEQIEENPAMQEPLEEQEVQEIPKKDEAQKIVQNLSASTLRDLLDGMQLDITIKISFPDKKDV